MGAESLNNLVRNRDAIRRIMAMDANGSMDSMLESAARNGRLTYTQDGDVNYNPGTARRNGGKIVVNEEVMKRSKMPKMVLESFQKNPGVDGDMQLTSIPSVLDSLELESLNVMRNEPTVSEQVNHNNGGNIDYSLLRTIINEAVQENVKKYMNALSKKLLTEGVGSASNGSVQAIKLGEKFSFITENGDVYEATLKYKTNLNESGEKKKTTNKK